MCFTFNREKCYRIIFYQPDFKGVSPEQGGRVERHFNKEVHEARILLSSDGAEEELIKIEIREDLFTGSKARVLTHRWRMPENPPERPDFSQSETRCPFCPGNRETATPRFPNSMVPGGTIREGQATVVPNAFPYSRYNAVVILSEDHFLSLDEFSPDILYEGFQTAVSYIRQIRQFDDKVAYASINWNYMPPAGGGIIHPHFQIVADKQPTSFHQKLVAESLKYRTTRERNYWADLVSFEEKEQERYIFRFGNIVFFAAYCPCGMLGEVVTLFEKVRTLDEVGEEGWKHFSEGLSSVLSCFHRMHFDSLNMTLLANIDNSGHFWTQARIIPRTSFPPLGISDVNYFEKGHHEVITVIAPEELARDIRALLE
jgi:UDPglucose--hexose-1-phosphate uridylyltransferase